MNTDALYRAIEQDRELQANAEQAEGALHRHRWHWTLNPDNADRVTVADYAGRLGVTRGTIKAQAEGYAAWLTAGEDSPETIAEHTVRARLKGERLAAVEAVAAATGAPLTTTDKSNSHLVRETRELAATRAARKGTTVGDELTEAAEFVAAGERARKARKRSQTGTPARRVQRIEGALVRARGEVRGALQAACDGELLDGERDATDHLLTLIDRSVEALASLRLAITGTGDIDWDAELLKIGGDR